MRHPPLTISPRTARIRRTPSADKILEPESPARPGPTGSACLRRPPPRARNAVRRKEYAMFWATFVAILFGMFAGVVGWA